MILIQELKWKISLEHKNKRIFIDFLLNFIFDFQQNNMLFIRGIILMYSFELIIRNLFIYFLIFYFQFGKIQLYVKL